MDDANNWIEWAFKGMVAGGFLLSGYVGSWVMASLKDIKDDMVKHKVKIAEEYIRRIEHDRDLDEMKDGYIRDIGEIKATNQRTHERIDTVTNSVDDIKKFLMGAAHGKH